MARKDIGTGWNRENRNAINDNFVELFTEYIAAGLNASEAKQKALDALNISEQAKQTADSAESTANLVQTQLDQVTGASTIDPAVEQMKVGSDGTIYNSPDERVRTEHQSVVSQLAQIVINAKYPPAPLLGLVGNDDLGDNAKLQSILDNYSNVFVPKGDYSFSETLKMQPFTKLVLEGNYTRYNDGVSKIARLKITTN